MTEKNESFNPAEINRYTAKIAHTEKSIRKMSEVQYSTFCFGRKVLQFVLAAIMIAFGVMGGTQNPVPLAALAVGCVMIVSMNHRPHHTADTIIRQFGGKLPKLHYFFADNGISTNQLPEREPYTGVSRLVEDSDYFYIFLESGAGYLIERDSVKGVRDEDGFREYLAEKSGTEWTPPTSLRHLNLKTAKTVRAARKKQMDRRTAVIGERLSDRPHRR